MKSVIKRIDDYILQDYTFLQDYEIIDGKQSNAWSFIGRIKNTNQLVKFNKVQYNDQCFKRFQSLMELYNDGVVLADNIFILQQNKNLYFYIIQAYIDHNLVPHSQSKRLRFESLQQYLNRYQSLKRSKQLFTKIKLLIEKLHQKGEGYAGLTSSKIIIDDENNVYLSPFPLKYELDNSNYENAYRPPEILKRIINKQYKIQGQDLLKWDYWSFGCITMEIFFISSPLYYSTSIQSQLKNINAIINFQNYIDKQSQLPLKNIILNSLEINPKLRTLSSQTINNYFEKTKKILPFGLNNNHSSVDMEKTINLNETTLSQIKNLQSHSQLQFQSINKCMNNKENNHHNLSQLILNILSIGDIQIQQQLNIAIYLDRKYSFYINKPITSNRKISIDKKIMLNKSFKQFEQILGHSTVIEIKEGQKIAIIKVNLQTLIMVHDGKRVWDKMLIGSYSVTEGNQEYMKCKLRISCQLKTPNIIQEDKPTTITPYKQKDKEKQTKNIEILGVDTSSINNNQLNKLKKVNMPGEISKVKQQLTNLAEHWKNRIQSKLVKDTDKQLNIEKLQRILKIN